MVGARARTIYIYIYTVGKEVERRRSCSRVYGTFWLERGRVHAELESSENTNGRFLLGHGGSPRDIPLIL